LLYLDLLNNIERDKVYILYSYGLFWFEAKLIINLLSLVTYKK